MTTWLALVDDGYVICEYTFVEAETHEEAKRKFKAYLSGRGIPAPDVFLSIRDTSRFNKI